VESRKEGRNPRRSLQEERTKATRGKGRRGGLSKFRLNSPRINIRNGAPGCHKLACCPLLSFPDSTICITRPVTVNFVFSHQCTVRRYNESFDVTSLKKQKKKRSNAELCSDHLRSIPTFVSSTLKIQNTELLVQIEMTQGSIAGGLSSFST